MSFYGDKSMHLLQAGMAEVKDLLWHRIVMVLVVQCSGDYPSVHNKLFSRLSSPSAIFSR
jgi:hypothetical protein